MNKSNDILKIASKNDILLNSLFLFYKEKKNIEKILPIINGQSTISLRILDWFVTNYSKKYNIIYNISNNIPFNVYLDYRLQLKAYNKKYFDPFCRKNRIIFYYQENMAIKTTVGQLNFFRWAQKNDIIKYVNNNLNDIIIDMTTIYQVKKKEKSDSDSSYNSDIILNNTDSSSINSDKIYFDANNDSENSEEKKQKRKELSQSATKTLNKHNITIKLNFD
jgi:hypothetical protein